jgi:hypothetical protein
MLLLTVLCFRPSPSYVHRFTNCYHSWSNLRLDGRYISHVWEKGELHTKHLVRKHEDLSIQGTITLKRMLAEIWRQGMNSCDVRICWLVSVNPVIRSTVQIGRMRNTSHTKMVQSTLRQVTYWTVRHKNPHITADMLGLCSNTKALLFTLLELVRWLLYQPITQKNALYRQCIWEFRIIFTNSDHFLQHNLRGHLCNTDVVCLLADANWFVRFLV